MEYEGGTYISQIESDNELNAMHAWINRLQVDEINGFTQKDKQFIIESGFIGEEPILLKGMKNIWHFLVDTEKGFGYINFVKTKKQ